MRQDLDEQSFRELEQLTEVDPQQFMQLFDTLEKQVNTDDQAKQLLYLRARALVTMNQKEEAEKQILDLLSTAVEQGNHLLISKCNLILSKCYINAEYPDKQKRSLDIAYEAAKSALDSRMIAECLIHTGSYHQSQNDRINALKCYDKAERLCEDLQENDITIQTKIAYGNTYYAFGEHHKALIYLTDAFQLSQQCEDFNRQLLIINNLSTLYSVLGRFGEAEEILNSGIQIAETNNIPMRKVFLLFNLGVMLMRQHIYQPALDRFLECNQFAGSIGFDNPQYQIELYSNMAGCYRDLKAFELAKENIEKAETLAKLIQNTKLAKEMELNKAILMLSMGLGEEAKKLILDVKKYFSKRKLYEQLIVAQMSLADYYEQKKDYHRTIKLLKEISPIYSEYTNQLMSAKASEFDAQLKALLTRIDEVQDNYGKLASRFTDRILGEFIGRSPHHRKVLETALMAAKHPLASVLITGESGTGKEVIANLIHLNSLRNSGPFVAVNVSAITSTLLESEFFGHRKGSFTGATSEHKGFFQQANRGTLFLDEIGDMPKELQSKLLRVLESRRVTPVGSATEIPFDCRIISSTNRNIEEMLKTDQFRLDLFHRLNTLEIHIPPLRNRSEDIPLLIDYFVDLLAGQHNRKKPMLNSDFVKRLKQYSFPGNVRELKNMIERLFILCPKNNWDISTLAYLTLGIKDMNESVISVTQATQQTEKELIVKALQETNGIQKDAAAILNMSESTLSRRINKYRLEVYTRKGK